MIVLEVYIKKPSMRKSLILRIFYSILYQCYTENGKTVRRLLNPFNDSQAKIIRYLELPESVFVWNDA